MQLPLALLGVVSSLLVTFLKRVIPGRKSRILAAVLVSFVAAGVYAFLMEFGLWGTFREVLVYAGAFYAFIWKHLEPKGEEDTWRSKS